MGNKSSESEAVGNKSSESEEMSNKSSESEEMSNKSSESEAVGMNKWSLFAQHVTEVHYSHLQLARK